MNLEIHKPELVQRVNAQIQSFLKRPLMPSKERPPRRQRRLNRKIS
jgi:hypothetical protein